MARDIKIKIKVDDGKKEIMEIDRAIITTIKNQILSTTAALNRVKAKNNKIAITKAGIIYNKVCKIFIC